MRSLGLVLFLAALQVGCGLSSSLSGRPQDRITMIEFYRLNAIGDNERVWMHFFRDGGYRSETAGKKFHEFSASSFDPALVNHFLDEIEEASKHLELKRESSVSDPEPSENDRKKSVLSIGKIAVVQHGHRWVPANKLAQKTLTDIIVGGPAKAVGNEWALTPDGSAGTDGWRSLRVSVETPPPEYGPNGEVIPRTTRTEAGITADGSWWCHARYSEQDINITAPAEPKQPKGLSREKASALLSEILKGVDLGKLQTERQDVKYGIETVRIQIASEKDNGWVKDGDVRRLLLRLNEGVLKLSTLCQPPTVQP